MSKLKRNLVAGVLLSMAAVNAHAKGISGDVFIDVKNVKAENVVPVAWDAVVTDDGESKSTRMSGGLIFKAPGKTARPVNKTSLYYELFYDKSAKEFTLRGHALVGGKRRIFYSAIDPHNKTNVIVFADPDRAEEYIKLNLDESATNFEDVLRNKQVLGYLSKRVPLLANERTLYKQRERVPVLSYGDSTFYYPFIQNIDAGLLARFSSLADKSAKLEFNCAALGAEKTMLQMAGKTPAGPEYETCDGLRNETSRLIVDYLDPANNVTEGNSLQAAYLRRMTTDMGDVFKLPVLKQIGEILPPARALYEIARDPAGKRLGGVDPYDLSAKIAENLKDPSVAEKIAAYSQQLAVDSQIDWVTSPESIFASKKGSNSISDVITAMDRKAAKTDTVQKVSMKDFSSEMKRLFLAQGAIFQGGKVYGGGGGFWSSYANHFEVNFPLWVVDKLSWDAFGEASSTNREHFVPARFLYRAWNTGQSAGRCSVIKYELFLNGERKKTGNKSVCD